MKKILFSSFVLVWFSLVGFSPSLVNPVSAMEFWEARHLLSRSGFGVNQTELRLISSLNYEDAVDLILNRSRFNKLPVTPLPDWHNNKPSDYRPEPGATEDEIRAIQQQLRKEGVELQIWWLKEMLATPAPLHEHLTLFWHNHFATELIKVKMPFLMLKQNQLLRRLALGNFRELVQYIAKDPAMLIYLDNSSNRKGSPNENFARELLELFTLGEGHYTETDIKEAARSFTGWTINRDTGEFFFNPIQHDFGRKTFLGRSGFFNGNDIINIVFEEPQTAIFIVEKLWREFISSEPESAEVERLAQIFRNGNYELKPLIRALFLSPAFHSPEAVGQLIKSPLELTIGTMVTFDIYPANFRPLLKINRELGQEPCNPPNVKGWPGGTLWISTSSLVDRRFLLQQPFIAAANSTTNSPPTRKSAPTTTGYLAKLLLPLAPVTQIDPDGSSWEVLPQLFLDPVYQLK